MKTGIVFDFDMTLVDYQEIDRKAILNMIDGIDCITDKESFYQRSGEIIYSFCNS